MRKLFDLRQQIFLIRRRRVVEVLQTAGTVTGRDEVAATAAVDSEDVAGFVGVDRGAAGPTTRFSFRKNIRNLIRRGVRSAKAVRERIMSFVTVH